MERKTHQLTFLDDVTSDLGGKRTAAFFAKCELYIPWQTLAEPLKDMYSNDTSKGGASNWPVVMMVKCMMLQKWFNLSDPMLEEMLSDRISFRRFVGLTMGDNTPDETVFVIFRRRLREHGDSAFMDTKRKEVLEARGVFCGIIERRVRGQKELTAAQKWHNRLVAGIRAVVEHPFAWMKNTGYRRVRYRGLSRNGLDFMLHAVAYNFKRSFSLQVSEA